MSTSLRRQIVLSLEDLTAYLNILKYLLLWNIFSSSHTGIYQNSPLKYILEMKHIWDLKTCPNYVKEKQQWKFTFHRGWTLCAPYTFMFLVQQNLYNKHPWIHTGDPHIYCLCYPGFSLLSALTGRGGLQQHLWIIFSLTTIELPLYIAHNLLAF